MKSMTSVGVLPVRKIVMLLFAGLLFSSLSVAAERPDKERKMQMKKAKELKKAKARKIGSVERRNSGDKCYEYSCKPCRLAKKGTTGTYSDKKAVKCPSNDLRGGGCDFSSSSQCGDSDSPSAVKL